MKDRGISPPRPEQTVRSTPRRTADWKSLGLVVAIAFANAISFQGSRGLYETTEGRYAECARETMLSGDLDDPILNRNPHWTKPPLTYMAIIAGMRTFGDSPWGVRAYLVVAMVLATAAVWWAGLSIWGPTAGRWAGIVFATSPAIAVVAHSVSTDMLVTLWTALAIAAFWHGRATHSRWAVLLMWGIAGLGCLTKGPPALLVPIATLPCAWWLLRRAGAWRPGGWMALVGPAVFLAIGFGWYAVEALHHPGLSAYWLGRELIARNTTSEFHRNPGFLFVFYVYVPMLLLGTGHWLLLILYRWRKSFNGLPLSCHGPSTWNKTARWSLIAGVILPFVVFSMSRSRLSAYLAPLFVPMCLLLGRGVDVLLTQGRLPRRTVAGLAGALLIFIVVLKGVAAIPESTNDMTRLAARLAPVLGRVQPETLYSVGSRRLNGLEFHLQRDVAPVEQGVFENQLRTHGQLDARAFYLIEKKIWGRMATNFAAKVQTEEIGPRWVGIRTAVEP
jgi:4-amino-4-deoxy-L-arabinose transferase-like glycosyltransferase